jgi:hypothetical protein
MNNGIITYSTTLNWQDLASRERTGNFLIIRSIECFLIKKIIINNSYTIPSLPVAIPVAEESLNDVGIEYLFSDAGFLNTNVFQFGALPIGLIRLDNYIVLSRSGSWDFNGIYVTNNLRVTYNYRNASLINVINLLSTIIVEIQDISR